MNDEIMTTEDIARVRFDIQTATEALYRKDGGADVSVLHPLVQGKLTAGNKETVVDSLKRLEQDLDTYSVLNISVPSVPQREFVRKICVWLMRTLGKKIVLSLTFDSTLLGGCTLSYEGKYLDHSLKKMADEYFEKKEDV
ncbi:MAG: hypothetical protein WC243_03455 [Patescibacteria group bacterium]|jgi:hypothetical protein